MRLSFATDIAAVTARKTVGIIGAKADGSSCTESIYRATSTIAYAQPMNIASRTPRLCLTATLSLLQLRLGILRFTLSPETAHRRVYICGMIITAAEATASMPRAIQNQILHISAGTQVKSK